MSIERLMILNRRDFAKLCAKTAILGSGIGIGLFAGLGKTIEAGAQVSERTAKKWTIMVYLAGDNDLDEDGARDIAEMAKVGSGKDINIIAQFDRAGEAGTQRLYITKDGGYPKDSIENLGETNTGDPKILADFLRWGITTYPAQYYMVVLWNHGSGWNEDKIYTKRQKAVKLGILYDDESKDFLDNAEMKNVLTEAAKLLPEKRFDILGFNADLMNTLEVNFQVKDTAKIIVGSEETEPEAGWPYDELFGALNEKPDMTPVEFSKKIVDIHIKSNNIGANSVPVTIAAVNLEKINDFMTVFNKWVFVLTKNIKNRETFDSFRVIVDNIQKFENQTYKDLFDFAKHVKEISNVKEIQYASQAVMDALIPAENNYVISAKSLNMENAHGVSIYFPGKQSYSEIYDKLDFSKRSKWNEFIKAYQRELYFHDAKSITL